MKQIAVFCDGTWNTPESQTNVHKLYWSTRTRDPQAANPLAAGDLDQVRGYFYGVGTDEENDIGWWDKITCGAFGKGLDGILYRAYRWLCSQYEPGDRIYLFGFSRGAYTARSLAGLLRTCGIVSGAPEPREDHMAEAMTIYRKRNRDDGPDLKAARDFRTAKSCAWAEDETKKFTEKGLGRPLDPRGCLRIRYVGVWDTVGALGIPENLPFSRHVNTKYRFHDCALSSIVEHARHAVAIDEHRHAFEPTLWTRDSIESINHMHKELRVEQDWFPGDHGSVGGGGEITALSDAALDWIAEGAERAGLLLDRSPGSILRAVATKNLELAPESGPVGGPLRNSKERENRLMRLRGVGARTNLDEKRRCVLDQGTDLSEGALARMRADPAYLNEAAETDPEARKKVRFRRKTLEKVLALASPPVA